MPRRGVSSAPPGMQATLGIASVLWGLPGGPAAWHLGSTWVTGTTVATPGTSPASDPGLSACMPSVPLCYRPWFAGVETAVQKGHGEVWAPCPWAASSHARVRPCSGPARPRSREAWRLRFCHLRFCLLLSDHVSSADQVACADPDICQKVCGNPSGCSDIAYPKLVLEILPTGNDPPPYTGSSGAPSGGTLAGL